MRNIRSKLKVNYWFVVLLTVTAGFYGCCSHQVSYRNVTDNFFDCIIQGKTVDILRYATEPTSNLVHKLLADTLCFDDSGFVKQCPGFRDVIRNVTNQSAQEDGTYQWPRIVRDSVSAEGITAWVWLQYAEKPSQAQYQIRLIYVDDAWLVDLPIIEDGETR